ncbi:hypothetical protein TA3x_004029 [Tundrisphaera sp. TA3]|uniref:hypothetical protein n=1 Tax=Tundrisphaera sp. TA3 TaxID=3435775 RepID=UPI003EB740C3
MPRPDPTPGPRPSPDWRGWIALAWAAAAGVLYARMVLEERAPGLLRSIGRLAGAG